MHKRSKFMMTAAPCLIFACALLLTPAVARADMGWVVADWSTILDGATHDYTNLPLPSAIDASGFHFDTGLGSFVFTIAGGGAHSAGVYLYEYYGLPLDPINHTGGDLSNAYGNAGSPTTPASVNWEMAWPGVATPSLFDRFAGAAALSNASSVQTAAPPNPDPPAACCSVGMAIIRDVFLNADQWAKVTFTVGTTAPSGFYLWETETGSGNTIYLGQDVEIHQTSGTTPEPATIWLLITSGAGAYWLRRRRTATNRNS